MNEVQRDIIAMAASVCARAPLSGLGPDPLGETRMPLTPEQKKALEARMAEFVGKPIGPPYVGRDPVNEPMIRQWCDAMGDTNPAYLDPEAATGTVHGELVAPPTMLQAWTMHGFEMAAGYDEPTNEEQRLHKILTDAGYTGVVGTNTEQGYTRYLRPGDVVTAEITIDSISEEKATALGIGYFIVTRTRFLDQDGEEIGWMTFRVLKYVPAQQPQAPAEEGAAPAVPGRIRPPLGHDNAPWWDEVNQGRIAIQSCNGCGQLHHPPRPMCDRCRGTGDGLRRGVGPGHAPQLHGDPPPAVPGPTTFRSSRG